MVLKSTLSAFLIFSLISLCAQKREQIEIIQANDLRYGEESGVKAQRLIGDVIFKHKNALMYCDSAYLYSKDNTIDAFGSVRINQGDTMNLFGDKLNYDGNTQFAKVTGKEVKLITNDFDLFTTQLNYDRAENQANYFSGATIESKNDSNILISRKGYYYANTATFAFRDSVVLTNPNFIIRSDTLLYFTNTEIVNFLGPTTITGDSNLIYCEIGWYKTIEDQSKYFDNAYIISDKRKLEGDTLFYDRALGFGQAKGDIIMTDTIQNILLNGQYGEIYEHLDSGIVTINPLLTQIFENDSLFMSADTFKFYKDLDTNYLLAYYDVKIYKSDLQGVCDSISYVMSDSTMKMYYEPILWSESNQLTSEIVELRLAKKELHSIFLDKNAFIISEVDSIRYNQIKGKELTGYFKNKKLNTIDVVGNGQTTYFGLDDKDKFIGVNVAESSNIRIKLDEDQIKSITFLNDADATMHPMGELDPITELRYRGFNWQIEKRPLSKESILK